jgi:hypothetical protein
MRSSDARPNLVIRSHSPLRRIAFASVLLLLAALSLYIAYEFGRYDAGYDRLAAAQGRTELQVAIERLEKSNHELRTQLAELDTIRIGRAREQAEVARSLGDLQAQVARQAQELAFYRGIVAQSAGNLGVKVQQLLILSGQRPRHYALRVALVRSVRPDTVATGTLGISIDGTGASGAAESLELAALTPGKQHEVAFNFRYFQNVEQEVTLPAGFRPEHVAIELRSGKKDVPPATQTFPWSLDEG